MLKRFIYLFIVGFAITSCATVTPSSSTTRPPQKDDQRPVRFIEHVSIKPFGIQRLSEKSPETRVVRSPDLILKDDIERSNLLQFKYSISLDVEVEALNNQDLLKFMDEWYGTRYRYGGLNKDGIDCSAFSAGLMYAVYGITVPRTVKEQYKATHRVNKDDLNIGDLVFFNTRGRLSHVGVYLTNNKFVHASRSSGVMISDLENGYFNRKFMGAGRVK